MFPKSMLSTLYVGNVHSEVTQSLLFETFSYAGRIHSVKICKNKKAGSPGYAYINFLQWSDAARAIKMYNFELLLGQPMQVMWSQRDLDMRHSHVGNLFIRNLDRTIDNMALFDTFSAFGTVLSCKVEHAKKGPQIYGYVRFASPEDAEKARKTLNGKILNNHQVFIEPFKPREARKPVAGCWPTNVTNNQVNVSCGQSKVERKNQISQVNEKHLSASCASTPSQTPEPCPDLLMTGQNVLPQYQMGSNLVIISNLDKSVDIMDLFNTLSSFGKLVSCKILDTQKGGLRTGYVQYESAQVADAVRKNLDGKLFNGCKISNEHVKSCEVCKAEAVVSSQTIQPEYIQDRVCLNTDAVGQSVHVSPTDPVPSTDTDSCTECVPVVHTASSTESVPVMQQDTTYVPRYGPSGKRLTYMLESTDLDVQMSMAYDYIFPLVEKIHPVNAKEMTRMILQGVNNFEIMDMYTCPETLHARVEEMKAIQKAREAGYTPEQIKVMFNLHQKKKSKKNKKMQRSKKKHIVKINNLE